MAIGRLKLKKMGYDFPPYRPPSESGSLLLRVTRGCTWNKCTFCSMYKNMVFERRPLDEIKADILSAGDYYSDAARTVFIADSNSLVINTDDFIEILKLLYASFPNIERVTSYARAKTLQKKPAGDLKRLRQAGLTRLHVGLETGWADLLRRIRKGATPDDFVEAGRKVKQAGFELSLYILLGLGGKEGWTDHARDTARVLNRIDPHFIRVRTVQPQPGSQLHEDIHTGRFKKAPPEIVLKEQRAIVENLNVTSQYLSDHITNYIPVNGKLPRDKNSMLQIIDEFLEALESDPVLQQKFFWKDGLNRL
jgi:radical SAM superfamily enzyme YgiQ (UPF0313 family)